MLSFNEIKLGDILKITPKPFYKPVYSLEYFCINTGNSFCVGKVIGKHKILDCFAIESASNGYRYNLAAEYNFDQKFIKNTNNRGFSIFMSYVKCIELVSPVAELTNTDEERGGLSFL